MISLVEDNTAFEFVEAMDLFDPEITIVNEYGEPLLAYYDIDAEGNGHIIMKTVVECVEIKEAPVKHRKTNKDVSIAITEVLEVTGCKNKA